MQKIYFCTQNEREGIRTLDRRITSRNFHPFKSPLLCQAELHALAFLHLVTAHLVVTVIFLQLIYPDVKSS